MSLTKIGSIGINTGIQFAGVTTVSTLHVGSGVTLSSDGDIFATGVSTFSGNLKVGSGVTISPDGDGFYTGVVTATTFSGALAASNLTSSVVPARVIPTPTFTPDPDVFASVIPITTVVVAAGAVYIPTVVTPTFAFVFNLNVFAIL